MSNRSGTNTQHIQIAVIDFNFSDELDELSTDLWKKSNHWVQNMIEVARETDIFQKTFKTIMSVLFMLPLNFWAEMKGMVGRYLVSSIECTDTKLSSARYYNADTRAAESLTSLIPFRVRCENFIDDVLKQLELVR